jgi:hypothetical protein
VDAGQVRASRAQRWRIQEVLPGAFYVLGVLELVLLVLFVTGTAKRFSYGAVLLLHAISTLSSYRQYLQPFDNLLFFAAWPMLAACAALYLLRDLDTYNLASFTRRSRTS